MAIDPVLIQFAVGGLSDVSKAFDTVETRVIRLEQASTRSVEAGSRTRVRAAQTETQERERAAQKLAQQTERLEAQKTRQGEQLAKTIDGIRRRSAELAGRYAEQEAAKEIRERKQTLREVEKLEEYKRRIMLRSAEMAGKAAEVEARAEETARARVNRGVGMSATRGIRGTLGGVASLAGGAMAIGGGFALADIVGKQMAAERSAALIVNAVTSGKTPPPGANVGAIMGASSQVAMETGMSKADVQSGMMSYVKSAKGGDFKGAMANMGFFAKLSKTTGADINDIASGAGMMQSQNQDLKAPQMQQMLLDMYAQGKQGSRSISEMVGLAGIIGSVRGVYGGKTEDNQRKLLGLTQLAAPEAGSAEEAARGVKQMSLNVEKKKNVGALTRLGVKYNEHGQVTDIEQMIGAVLSGTGGNLQKIAGAGFDTRSGGLMRHMADTFNKSGGGATGLAAAKAEMATVTQATTSPQDLEAQFQQMMSTPAEKFQRAVVRIEETIANRLEPWLSKAADQLERLTPDISATVGAFAEALSWLASNPWQGLGLLMAGAITKDIAQAAVGKTVANVLSSSLGSKFATGLTIATAAFAITEVGMMVIDRMQDQEIKRQQGAVNETNSASNVASTILGATRTGKVTPEQIAEAQKQVKALEAKRAEQSVAASGSQWSMVTGFVGASDRQSQANAELKNTEQALKMLNKALAVASAQLGNLGASAANSPARNVPISQRPAL